MRTNTVLEKFNKDERAIGCALVFPSTDLVELVGIAGMDYLYIDGEHGAFAPDTIVDMCRVADLYGITPVARVPNILPSTIGNYLDWGLMGIEGPHVSSRADAQQFADACYYSPIGKRSLGASRGALFETGPPRTQYAAEVNSQTYVFAILEDVEAVDNIDEILEVDGIHSYHVGTKDLAMSMGLPGEPDHPRVQEVASKMEDAIHAAGKKTSEEVMALARGSHLFLDGATSFIEQVRGS
jgi:4-hydroxy-2-oxoheptanedioate aldolase